MLAAVSFDDILRRCPAFGKPEDPLGQRLISIVFARPSSPVWHDLVTNRAFLDSRSGNSWDLFFAGMSAFDSMKGEPNPVRIVDPFWRARKADQYMNPEAFRKIEEIIYRGQQEICGPLSGGAQIWRYSGETDVVSFMCYAREPDWASLRFH